MSYSRIYACWKNMRMRCTYEKYRDFHRYGGRGIKVCDRWSVKFLNFYEDMGDIPKGHTLDRIDNDKNYTPDNCRWSTPKEQAANRTQPEFRSNNTSGFVGIDKNKGKWRARFAHKCKTYDLGYFPTRQEAIDEREKVYFKIVGKHSVNLELIKTRSIT